MRQSELPHDAPSGRKGKRRLRSGPPAGDSRSVAGNGESNSIGGEQPLPPYGCCDLGSANLTRFVVDPFGENPRFDWESFKFVIRQGVRFLDNVLDVTVWPLPEQQAEAMAKRRIGLGFIGLGDTLIMMKLRYDSQAARDFAAKMAEFMRDEAYEASVDLAIEKGAFPLFDADQYLAEPRFAARLPAPIQERIRQHGIRNSHLLSIAPTGTITLAFADNASNGIEPAFSWFYNRNKRMPDNSMKQYAVEDHAWRLYKAMGGDVDHLPDYFVTALELSALDHMRMSAAVQPYVDSAISKTVNVPEDYPYEEFKDLYMQAWKSGLKGITTYRPNAVLGAVLEVASKKEQPNDLSQKSDDPDRRIRVDKTPEPALASLRWPGRPKLVHGNPAWAYMVEHPWGSFAVFVGHVENGRPHPFEVWACGNETPRGLGAVAKTLSMDMRAEDRGWLKRKLEALKKAAGDDAFEMPDPRTGDLIRVPSLVSGLARIVEFRCEQLGALTMADGEATPVLDAMIARKEPKAGPDGTMSWTTDVLNASSGDDFVLGVKELVLPDGQRRPFSMWLSGDYPKVLDGLCKLLSLDMMVIDPGWIGLKLRKLLNFGEPLGDFMARVPGSEKSATYPSTVAYIARLIIHRYAMLGILDEEGYPVKAAGVLADPEALSAAPAAPAVTYGKKCPECRVNAMIRKDGCDFCTNCGAVGTCG